MTHFGLKQGRAAGRRTVPQLLSAFPRRNRRASALEYHYLRGSGSISTTHGHPESLGFLSAFLRI
jgi:hypothetical protein